MALWCFTLQQQPEFQLRSGCILIVSSIDGNSKKSNTIGGKNAMSKIQDLLNEVETYKQAIQDAKDALASAEMELDEALDEEFNQ